MNKIISFLFFGLTTVALISCSESKDTVYEKCLTQVNQTFNSNDIEAKAEFVISCMREQGYRLNAGCDKDDSNEMLSSICYVKNELNP